MTRPYTLPDVFPTEYDQLNPSEVTGISWIHAFRKKGTYFNAKPGSGKWLVFVSMQDLDHVWKNIKHATEEGLLGTVSKVATTKDSPYSKNKNERVICVNTYDCEDRDDVMFIRHQLRLLGVTKKIPYKMDQATHWNKYSSIGDKNISMYFE